MTSACVLQLHRNKKIQQIVFSAVSMHQLSRHNIRQCMGLVHFATRKIVTSPIPDVKICYQNEFNVESLKLVKQMFSYSSMVFT